MAHLTGLYFRDGILIRHLWFRELLRCWGHPVGQRQGKGPGHITAPGDPVGAADPGVPEDICRHPPTCPACGAWGAPVAPVSPLLPFPCPSKRARCENWGHRDWGPAWRGWWLGWARPGAGCACTGPQHSKITPCSGFPHLPKNFLSAFYCSKSPKKMGELCLLHPSHLDRAAKRGAPSPVLWKGSVCALTEVF